MVLKYVETARLGRGQTSGISAVAFSPLGTLLASAGLDGKVCIWNVRDRRLLFVFSAVVPVLALTWVGPAEDVMICGLLDGNVVCLMITELDVHARGFWAHTNPVECVSATDNLLATGAHEELRVWRRYAEVEWVHEADLQAPSKTSFNRFLQVVVTSLHWVVNSQGGMQLVATYLNHGVHIYDAATYEKTRSIPIPGQIAAASISSDGSLIAISNVISGFDIYSVETGAALCSFGHTVGEFRKVPVIFVHDGLALVGGNIAGDVHIWDVGSGSKLHSLVHAKEDQVLALAAYYDQGSDTFLIATGILKGSSESAIVLWKTEELGQSNVLPGDRRRYWACLPSLFQVFEVALFVALLAVVPFKFTLPTF